TLAGACDAFVTQFSPSGTLIYSTYLGGAGDDSARGIALDPGCTPNCSVYVAGYTQSANFPTRNAVQAGLRGGYDAFVTKVNATGSALVYSTYLGGGNDDQGYSIGVDGSGNAYVVGFTVSADFPTQSPLQALYAGSQDAFVTKLNAGGTALVYSTYL